MNRRLVSMLIILVLAFPIGLYAFPGGRSDDAIWKEASEAGFNFVISKKPGKYGMYTAREVPEIKEGDMRLSFMSIPMGDRSILDKLRNFIRANEGDTTVVCWLAPDEPSWFGPPAELLEFGYKAIRSMSRKPVWLNCGPSYTEMVHFSYPRAYMRTCDIFSEDIYPIPDGKLKRGQGYNKYAYLVGEHTRRLVELASIDGVQKNAVWMVLQGFGWSDLKEKGNPSDFVPPTRHELRFMVYDAIVNGATGILFWGVHKYTTDSKIWKNLKSMATELNSIYELLTCPLRIRYNEIKADNDQIKLMVKYLGGNVYILAVNERNTPTKQVRFTTGDGDSRLSKVEVLFENRTISPGADKSWSDDFAGYDVHLYKTDLEYRFMFKLMRSP